MTGDDPLGAFVPGERAALPPTGSGALDGTTFAAKDVFDVAGFRTGFGNPTWLETHPPATETAPAVERLLAAGASLAGKTISDEFTYSLTGANVHYGTPVNARCPERLPGGSSSGSASAVAGGACDFALGTDCAGSVRIPASYCGLFGIRPTHGRIPLAGVCPFAPSFDTAGVLARDPALLETAARALLEPGREPPAPARLLVAHDVFELAGPAVAAALAPGLAAVEAVLGEGERVTVAPGGLGSWLACFRTIQAFEIWRSLGAWVEEAKPELGPGIRERFQAAARVSGEEADAAREAQGKVVERLRAVLPAEAVLCLPSAPGPAPRKDASGDEIEVVFRERAISLLCIANLGGLPQVTMPLGELEGCPIGLSLVGARDADRALLALAREFGSASAAPI